MRRSTNREVRELESELRSGRPEPRLEFLHDLALRVEGAPTRMPLGWPRIGAALAFSVVVLAGAAAFGGVGYAKSSIVSAVKSSKQVVSAVVTNTGGRSDPSPSSPENDRGVRRDPPSVYQFSHFVLVCHGSTGSRRQHHTVVVPQALVSQFVPALATLGPCDDP